MPERSQQTDTGDSNRLDQTFFSRQLATIKRSMNVVIQGCIQPDRVQTRSLMAGKKFGLGHVVLGFQLRGGIVTLYTVTGSQVPPFFTKDLCNVRHTCTGVFLLNHGTTISGIEEESS